MNNREQLYNQAPNQKIDIMTALQELLIEIAIFTPFVIGFFLYLGLKNPENKNQVHDWNTWCPGATIGEVINSPINPILYSR